jgi:4-hydroxy-3-methylbut-2-enyl diphosphate reductase
MAIKKLLIARPRGFCAGVEMAVLSVEKALERYGAPMYVFHEIVHNKSVVEAFQKRGVVFVSDLDSVPARSVLLFSAHGISPEIRTQAERKGLRVAIDATCPLVQRVHREVRRFVAEGYHIVLVGHEGHDEIVGTTGEAPDAITLVSSVEEANHAAVPASAKIVVLTQTTLSLDDTREIVQTLKKRFPQMVAPPKEDICYATQNRQDAVKLLAKEAGLILVVGSFNSENSNQLCKVARDRGIEAHLINDAVDIHPSWLEGVEVAGVTSGASAPERLVSQVVDFFRRLGVGEVAEIGFQEANIHFALPTGLEARSTSERRGQTH